MRGGKKALAAGYSRVFISAKHHCLITDRSRKETKLHYIKPAFNTEIHPDNIAVDSLSAGSHPPLTPDRESVMRYHPTRALFHSPVPCFHPSFSMPGTDTSPAPMGLIPEGLRGLGRALCSSKLPAAVNHRHFKPRGWNEAALTFTQSPSLWLTGKSDTAVGCSVPHFSTGMIFGNCLETHPQAHGCVQPTVHLHEAELCV